MDKVATFEVDHTQLKPGVYISRQDSVGEILITTFDVRMKQPYREATLSPSVIHTLEHLVAVYLREKSNWSSHVLYWGPMGCQTGFDLLVTGEVSAKQIVSILREAFEFVAHFEGDIPGAQFAWQCGNYQLHDLSGARNEAKRFSETLKQWRPEDSIYPRRTN